MLYNQGMEEIMNYRTIVKEKDGELYIELPDEFSTLFNDDDDLSMSLNLDGSITIQKV